MERISDYGGLVRMSLRIAYVDESHDNEKFCLSALIIRHREWKQCFEECKALRFRLREDFGIKPYAELHAYKLVRGKGRSFLSRNLGKWERSRAFLAILRAIANLPGVMLLNVVLEKQGRKDAHLLAWDRLFNRLERTARAWEEREVQQRSDLLAALRTSAKSEVIADVDARLKAFAPRFIVVADAGREREITRALRKMHVHNPVPSQFGSWETGSYSKNILVSRIIEDPVFRDSKRSLFIQLADAAAYALLKREVTPTSHSKAYGIHTMFDETLAGVCFRAASKSDSLGIVRK